MLAKKTLSRLIYAITALLLLLVLVDRFPYLLTAFSIASHAVYLQNLRRFPIVKLTDPVFLLSCVLVLLNHYLWFRHFSSATAAAAAAATDRYGYRPSPAHPDQPTFTEIASFFGLCVWLVPFALFISLSAAENVLPSMGSEYATGRGSSYISAGAEPAGSGVGLGSVGGRKRSGTQSGMAKAAVNGVKGWVGETGELMGFWRGERTRPL